MNKVQVIQRSMECAFWAWLSLIPGLGLLAALVALIQFFEISARCREGWNPAGRYLHWAASLSAFSLLIQSLAMMVLLVQCFG
jgi:hypothetical protein